jgi:peptidoglycan/LPS O-acetylase OafA/YrhL
MTVSNHSATGWTSGGESPQDDHLAGLDSIRALAVIAVVAFHLVPALIPGGFVGVDVFFVISGFLITTLLLRQLNRAGRVDFWDFSKRRVRRLLPAAALAVTVTGMIAYFVGGDVLVGVPAALLGIATISSNWVQLLIGNDYFARAASGLFDNFWSLAIEEQFYLLWPAALALIWRTRSYRQVTWMLGSLTVLAGVSPLVLGATGHTDWAYLSTFGHGFGLLLGATAAIVAARYARVPLSASAQRGWAATAVFGLSATLVVICAPIGTQPLLRPAMTVAASVTTLLVLHGTLYGAPKAARALDRGVVGWTGRRAYGIYLWHFPLIVLADAMIPASREWGVLPGRVLAVVVAIAAAYLSYRFVEGPVRRRGFRAVISERRGGVVAIALSSTLVLTSCGIVTSAPEKTRLQQTLPGQATTDGDSSTDSSAALPASARKVVAVGDSVMLASSSALKKTFPGITVDATVDRQLANAPKLVAKHLAEHPGTTAIVIGLGVNGVGGASDLRAAIDAARGLPVVLMSISGPVSWESSVNAAIVKVASEYSNVAVGSWKAAAEAHPQLIASDGVHPGEGGGKLYAEAAKKALVSLP